MTNWASVVRNHDHINWPSATYVSICGVCVCVCACARMCETKKMYMCKQTRAGTRKRVHECMNVHMARICSSALLLDFYLSTPCAAGRAHMHQNVCVAIGVLLRVLVAHEREG